MGGICSKRSLAPRGASGLKYNIGVYFLEIEYVWLREELVD